MSDLNSIASPAYSTSDHPALGASHDGGIGRPGRGYVAAALLVLLQEREGHGWTLMGRLHEIGVSVPDTAGLYRVLRQMENDQLVTSHWDHSEQGPARRVYAISTYGVARLHRLAPKLAAQQRSLAQLLRRYRKDRCSMSPSLKAV